MTNRIAAKASEDVDLSQTKTVVDQAEITDVYALYLDDESHSYDGAAEKIIFPSTEAEVAAIMKRAFESDTPVTIQGGRTGLTGAAVPLGGIALNLEKMTHLLYMNYDESKELYSIAAQCGMTLEDLVEKIQSKKLADLQGKGTPEQEKALDNFMKETDTFTFPVDPTETSAWLGGIVACNASGARTFKYGAVRPWVCSLRVVLANGDILEIERGKVQADNGRFVVVLSDGTEVNVTVPTYKMPQTKNAAGLYAKPDMDLIDLFIGSEGILGVITEVELGLVKLEENIMTVMAFFPSIEDAVNFTYDVRAPDSPIRMDFLEYFGPNAIEMIKEKAGSAGIKVPAMKPDTKAIIFFEFSFTPENMEELVIGLEELLIKNHSSSESSWAGMDRAELAKMKTVRHFVPETVNGIIAQRKAQYPEIHKIGTDMAVPDAALKDYLQYYITTLEKQGMEYAMWGHIGNNHIHVNMLPRNNEEVEQGMDNYMTFAKRAIELGGTVAAEHGIGKLKRAFLESMYGEKGIAEMQAVKRSLDPKWLINRGDMVAVPADVS